MELTGGSLDGHWNWSWSKQLWFLEERKRCGDKGCRSWEGVDERLRS
jgi:hypothetical protein